MFPCRNWWERYSARSSPSANFRIFYNNFFNSKGILECKELAHKGKALTKRWINYFLMAPSCYFYIAPKISSRRLMKDSELKNEAFMASDKKFKEFKASVKLPLFTSIYNDF